MKTIKYIPKTTLANTEYRQISDTDMQWIQTSLLRILSRMAELSVSHSEDHKLVLSDYWRRRRKSLPRRRDGDNTPESFVGGLVNNLVFGTQRDITDRQMEGLEQVYSVLNVLFPEEFEHVRFQVGFE